MELISTAIHGELQSKQENAQNPSTHDRIYGVQTSKATLEKLSLRDGRRGTRNNRTEHLQRSGETIRNKGAELKTSRKMGSEYL